MIFTFFFIVKKLSTEKIFTKEIATALLVGISTDTGSFSYSCNHPDVYNAVATLLKTGVKANKIHQQIFDTYSINRMNLLGYAISKKLKIFAKERAAFIYLSKKRTQLLSLSNRRFGRCGKLLLEVKRYRFLCVTK